MISTVSSTCTAPAAARWRTGPRERYPEGADRLRLRVQADDQGEGVRRGARRLAGGDISNVGVYGTGQGYEALLLRMRAHALPEAQIYAQLDARGAAQGDPVVPVARRSSRPRRRVDRVPRQDPDDTGRPRVEDLCERGSPTHLPTPSPSSTGIPRAKTRCWPRSVIRTRISPKASCSIGCAGCRPTIASRWCTPTSAIAPIVGTSPDARSSAPTTASTSSATTARSAISSVTGC